MTQFARSILILETMTVMFLALYICSCNLSSKSQNANALSQQLQIIWVVALGGDSELHIQGLTGILKEQEIALLKGAGVKGVLVVRSSGEVGERHDRIARVIVVMSRQLTTPKELPQPDGTNALFIQNGENFELLPEGTLTLNSTIRLQPMQLGLDPSHPHLLTSCTKYEITREDGGVYGGTAFIWNYKE